MPSASSKLESHGSQETLDPFQRVQNMIEKKIRNLEKRKLKLESYREELSNGKELNADQQEAVKLYDAVVANLELSREYSGQIGLLMVAYNKEQKKQQKKLHTKRFQEDLDKVKEIIRLQDVLHRMGQENVREDFLAGTNGAVQISSETVDQLDTLYKLVTPSRENVSTNEAFEDEVAAASKHLLNLIDGRPKEVASTTYENLRKIIRQIATCSYPEVPAAQEISNETEEEGAPEYTNGLGDTEDLVEANLEQNQVGVAVAVVTGSSSLPEPSPSLIPTTSTGTQSVGAPTQLKGSHASKATDWDIETALEAPPPGLPTNTLSPAHIEISTSQEGLVSAVVPVNSAVSPTVSQVPPSQSFFSHIPPPSQVLPVSLDLNDLVSSARFDFLQESQVVQETPTVYMDPAVVSIGGIKPDLTHLHEAQPSLQQQLQQASQSQSGSLVNPDSSQCSNMPGQQTYAHPPYSGMGVSSFAGSAIADIPKPSQDKLSSFTQESSWSEQVQSDSPSDQQTQQTTVDDDSGWGEVTDDEHDEPWSAGNGWDEPEEKISNTQNDADRHGGQRGRGFIGRGGRGSFRGRGGNGFSYQNNRGVSGNSSYGFRGSRGSNIGTGFRGGNRGVTRGGSGQRNGFRGGRGGGGYQRHSYQQ